MVWETSSNEVKKRYSWIVVGIVLLYRFFILGLLRTSYTPDEYYQYIDPASRLVTGSSLIELSWEWQPYYRLRSYLSLLVCSGIQRVLADNHPGLWALIPRFIHCIWTIVADFSLYSLSRSILSQQYAVIVLAVHLSSWFVTYCGCRSLSNTLEMDSFLIGLFFVYQLYHMQKHSITPQQYHQPRSFLYLALLALLVVQSVFSRPTAALLWAPLLCVPLFLSKLSSAQIIWFLRCGLWLTCVAILIDSVCYGAWTLTPLNFFLINVLQKKANHFGTSPWYWPLTHGLPVSLGAYLPIVGFGVFWRWSEFPEFLRWAVSLCLWYIVALRVATAHQEERFLLPILPLLHLVVAWVVQQWLTTNSQSVQQMDRSNLNSIPHQVLARSDHRKTIDGPVGLDRSPSAASTCTSRWKVALLSTIAAAQILGAMYLLVFHQAGTEGAFTLLQRHLYAQRSKDLSGSDYSMGNHKRDLKAPVLAHVVVAAPCHAFPPSAFLSTPALPIAVYYPPTCSLSPWEVQEQRKLRFDSDPAFALRVLLERLPSRPHPQESSTVSEVPLFVVTFDAYEITLRKELVAREFELWANLSHAHFRYDFDDPYPKQRVLVYQSTTKIHVNS